MSTKKSKWDEDSEDEEELSIRPPAKKKAPDVEDGEIDEEPENEKSVARSETPPAVSRPDDTPPNILTPALSETVMPFVICLSWRI